MMVLRIISPLLWHLANSHLQKQDKNNTQRGSRDQQSRDRPGVRWWLLGTFAVESLTKTTKKENPENLSLPKKIGLFLIFPNFS